MAENDLQQRYNALRRQGLSHEDAIGRLNASRGVSAAPQARPAPAQPGGVLAGLGRGVAETAASYAGGLGWLGEKVGVDTELRERAERFAEERPELTRAGEAARIAGRIGSELVGSIGAGGLALRGATKVPAIGRALTGASRARRAAATAAASVPVDVAQAAAYREGAVLPGFGGALAENIALSGAAGALLPAMRAPAREAAAEFDIRAPLRQEEVPLRRLATPSPQEVERFGERALSTQEAIEAAAAARAAEPGGIVVEGYRRRSPQKQAARMRQLGSAQRLAEEISRRQRMAGPSEEASRVLEAAAEQAARVGGEEGLVRAAYRFPSPLESLLTGGPQREVAGEIASAARVAEVEPVAQEAIEEAARTVRQGLPSRDLIGNVPISKGGPKRQGFFSTTDNDTESVIKRSIRGVRSRVFDRNAPLLDLFELTGGPEAKRRANGLIAQLDAATQSAVANIKTSYQPWLQANADRLDEISRAAAIRADVSNRNYIENLIRSRDQALKKIENGIGTASEIAADKRFVARIRDDIEDLRGVVKIPGYTMGQVDEAYQQVMSNPYLREKTDELMGFFRDILQQRRAAGIISEDEFKRIVDSADYYTPLYKGYLDEVSGGAFKARAGRLTPQKGVRAMDRFLSREGTIQDPVEVLLGERVRLEKDLRKQNILNYFNEVVGDADIPGLIRRVPEGESPSRTANVFTAVQDGERFRYEVLDKDLFDAITQQSTYSQGFLMDIARRVGDIKRAGITILPDFSAMALMRDLPIFTIQRGAQTVAREGAVGGVVGAGVGAATAEEGERLEGALRGAGFGISAGALARPMIEIGAAIADIAGDTRNFRQFLEEGGSTAGVAITDPRDMRKLLDSLSKNERDDILSNVISSVRPLDALRFIGMAAENAPRLAEFKRAVRAGEQMPEAVWAAQNITLPFARKGASSTIRKMSEITPFFNATLRGWAKIAELFPVFKGGRVSREGLKKAGESLAAVGSVIAAPTIALWTVNKDNPEYWEKPLWLRNTFWMVPKDLVTGGDEGGFYYIPKPFELGFAFASVPERMLDAYARSGGLNSAAPVGSNASNELARSAYDFFKSGVTGTVPIPAVAQPALEMALNKDIFRGRPITSEYLQARAPEYRYRASTPGILRAAGRESAELVEQLGLPRGTTLSPSLLEYLVGSVGGTAGRRAIQALDVIAQGGGEVSPLGRATKEQVASQLTGLSRFTERPSDVSQLEYDAANLIDRGEQANRDFNRLVRERAPRDEVVAMQQRYQEELREHQLLQAERLALSRVREERRRVIGDRQLTNEERRRQLDRLTERGSNIARRVFEKISASRERNQ